MTTTYHLNKKGYYAPCKASKRACPITGLSDHISQTQFDALKKEGDPTVAHNFAASETSYYTQAKNAYERLITQKRLNAQVEKEVDAFNQKQYAELGLIDENGKLAISYKSGWDEKDEKDKAIDRLRELYVEEGVNPAKARFIAEDIAKQRSGIKAVIRKTDKLDPEIEEKTRRAAERSTTDPVFLEHESKHSKYVENNAKFSKAVEKGQAYRKELVQKYQAEKGVFVGYVEDSTFQNVTKKYEEAIAWKKGGIPDTAHSVKTESLKQEDLSVDSKGRINNAWVRLNNGKVEKIVGFRANDKPTFGTSDHLYTESGTMVSSGIHYHSYTKSVSGFGNIIVGDKNGSTFTSDTFNLQSVLDSGD